MTDQDTSPEAAEADLTDLAQKSTRLITRLEAERDGLVKRLRQMSPELDMLQCEDVLKAADLCDLQDPRVRALEAENARLREALSLYSCDDGCNDCPEHERDRVGCGWTALRALEQGTP